ncbi:MAG: sterol desaturase family protein [Cyclobacteriaceae bacterium]
MLFSSLVQKYGVLITWLISTSLIFFRYLFFAGLAYAIFYVWKKKKLIHFKIQKQFPKNSQVSTELKYSLLSASVFGVFAFFIFWLNSLGLTQMYRDVHQYSYGYLFLSWLLMILFHDTYFYWTHRLMHHPRLFKTLHKVHHYSHNPTPWAAFAFHPLEALVEFAVLPLAVVIIPMHPLVIFAWSIWMIAWNVIGHLGFEIFPIGFVKHSFFQWFNTSTHHNLHHERSQGNYSLYFNIWDRWMNTNQKNYAQVFTTLKENQI